ncbi:hypothetical protein [Mycobacterium avium]|nr:hypothetical protein [Mycobacterium avium]
MSVGLRKVGLMRVRMRVLSSVLVGIPMLILDVVMHVVGMGVAVDDLTVGVLVQMGTFMSVRLSHQPSPS